MNDQRNLILAIAITMLLLFGFDFYMSTQIDQQAIDEQFLEVDPETGEVIDAPQPAPSQTASGPGVDRDSPQSLGAPRPRDVVIAESPRIAITSPRLTGSIRLQGGRIDDLTLLDYRETIDPNSPDVILLSPVGTANPYYADYGWVSNDETLRLPDAGTPWQADGNALTPDTPVTLTWDNGQGLKFFRTFALDENYMVTVTQGVENNTGKPVQLNPYGLVNRTNTPQTTNFFILHEGLIGVLDGTLEEIDYDDMQEDRSIAAESTGGWLGITDKYWLMALIPDQSSQFNAEFRYAPLNGRDRYQTNFVTILPPVEAGTPLTVTTRLFAGAKVSSMIDAYEAEYNITNFDRAIDWGWFYWLTKPIFWMLDYLNGWVGNFGVAILILTVLIKLVFFQLANKSYVAMGAMRKLQPKMVAIRERHKDDPVKQREAMMKLYKDEKVNPVSGCLPILIQIPVFFALYKVLFVSIEMRHAPFFGWVQDLSAPDPLLVTTLFGLSPWDPPTFLAIGVWPILMGLTMWGQQKLNPAPPDPIQAKIFMALPIVFTFLLASFPVGLVIYWTWNNLLTIAQQWFIMKRHGAFD